MCVAYIDGAVIFFMDEERNVKDIFEMPTRVCQAAVFPEIPKCLFFTKIEYLVQILIPGWLAAASRMRIHQKPQFHRPTAHKLHQVWVHSMCMEDLSMIYKIAQPLNNNQQKERNYIGWTLLLRLCSPLNRSDLNWWPLLWWSFCGNVATHDRYECFYICIGSGPFSTSKGLHSEWVDCNLLLELDAQYGETK